MKEKIFKISAVVVALALIVANTITANVIIQNGKEIEEMNNYAEIIEQKTDELDNLHKENESLKQSIEEISQAQDNMLSHLTELTIDFENLNEFTYEMFTIQQELNSVVQTAIWG